MAAAQVEAELVMARQLAGFQTRDMKQDYAGRFNEAETLEKVNEVLASAREAVDAFEAALNTDLDRIVGIAQQELSETPKKIEKA
jgi:hypothetical protein